MWQIRKCSSADFDRVAALLRQLWPNKPMDASRLKLAWDRSLASTSQRLVCAVENGDVLGFCSLSIKNSLWNEGPLAHVDELIVAERAREQGIGTGLMDYVIDLAEKAGCTRVELDSAFHREQAHAYYESKGFEKRAFLFSLPI